MRLARLENEESVRLLKLVQITDEEVDGVAGLPASVTSRYNLLENQCVRD